MAKRTARIPLMAGNWKMNLDHVQAAHLVQKLDWTLKDAKHDFSAVEVAVLAPFTDLRTVQTLVEGDHLEIRYGGQDLSTHDAGAYTGEISGQMLAKLGCTYVVVGHSERREYHGEDDAEVRAKVHAALKNGLAPLLCVGEGLPTRQAGEQVEFTVAQVSGALEGISRRAGQGPGRRLRAGLGDRHRRGRHAGRTPRRCAPRSGAGWASCSPRSRRPAPGCCTADRSSPPTSPRSWPSRTSTAASVGGASLTPTSSPRSAATGST